MGRPQINRIPEGAVDCPCSQCHETKPADAFYYRKNGSRNPWCKDCYKQWMKAKAAAGDYKSRPAAVPCEACGATFETSMRNATQRFCEPCSKDRQEFQVWLRGVLQIAARAAQRENEPASVCPHCGDEFRSVQTKKVYCSDKCNSAAHHLKRGAGRLGPGRRREIERAYIIARDGSRCHMCRKTCRPDEIHLDHLVPLSRGGSHDESNLRVACATCNTSKGASARNEQLMAFG